MPKNVESNIRNVGHQPGDLDEIARDIPEKSLCSLPLLCAVMLHLNTVKKKRIKGSGLYLFVHPFDTSSK